MRCLTIFCTCLTVCLLGCKTSDTPTSPKEQGIRPQLPTVSTVSTTTLSRPETIVAINDSDTNNKYKHILEHPWVKLQTGLTHVTHAMVDDITSLSEGHDELNKYRAKAGLPTTSFEDESRSLIATIQEIQATLDPLNLQFPHDRYSVLNIPETAPELYSTLLPFQVYKRVEMGETELGIPVFLDVRVFDISQQQSAEAKQEAIQSIIDWHAKLLRNSAQHFKAYAASDALVLIGRGDRDRSHFDGGHGFATKDRGVLLAFLTDGKHLFVLDLDAPWKDVEGQEKAFKEIINRPLKPWTQPLSAFTFSPY